MMFYYIDKIEQVDAPEGFPWTVNEYGSRTQYKESLPEVQSRYYKALSDIWTKKLEEYNHGIEEQCKKYGVTLER